MWNHLVDRQTGILNFTPAMNDAIRACRVAVFGGGGNGCVLDYLVRTGFEIFHVIDYDQVEASNLNRLPFYPDTIGMLKIDAWRRHLLRINPACQVFPHQQRITRNDEDFVRDIVQQVDIVALGTSDLVANFLIARVCSDLKKRMVVGPGTAGCWVVSTLTHQDGVSIESVGEFGTEGVDPRDVDYAAIRPAFMRMYMFPGRRERLQPGVARRIAAGEIAPRTSNALVSLANAAACWETVRNVAEMNALPLEITGVIHFPVLQLFDPFRGSAFYWNASTGQVGIPDWLTGDVRWNDYKDGR